ncbi:MAG: type II secretion system F family protein [Lachnospiraceae bacterium]|nr:type II secretion system F family protein [Lachnospiraceae bacterium]
MNNNGLDTPFSNSEISAFCGQMALILKSGISSIEGLSIMLEDAVHQNDREFLQRVYQKLVETGSLCQAISSTGVFPPYMLQMLEIGEQTGNMDDCMEHLSQHYAREHSISQSLRHSIIYPFIMTGMMVVVIIVLLVKVMPIFNQVFIQLGTEMTGFSKTLMDIGNVINHYSVALVILLALIVLFVIFCTHTETGRTLSAVLKHKLPFLRTLQDNAMACRFASGMALTLSSGLDTRQSLHLAGALNNDPYFSKKMEMCFQYLESGMDMYKSIHAAGIFSGVYARMASLGAKTGTMDRVMEQIATRYQEEVDERIQNLLAILEPTLVIILSLFVGIILLSVMLPLIGIMSSI